MLSCLKLIETLSLVRRDQSRDRLDFHEEILKADEVSTITTREAHSLVFDWQVNLCSKRNSAVSKLDC